MKVFYASLLATTMAASGASAYTIDFAGFSDGDLFTTFDFDGLTGSVVVTNNDVSPGDDGPEARIFDTTNQNSLDPDLEGDFTNIDAPDDPAVGFGNALIIQERADKRDGIPDDERSGGSITFLFDQAIDLLSLTYLDGEEGANIFASMEQIGSVSGADNMFDVASFLGDSRAENIVQFRVDFNGSGAIGEIEVIFTPEVPVPAGLPLLLTGFGAFAYMRRKKQKV